MVSEWKRQAVEHSAPVFSGKAEAPEVGPARPQEDKDLNGQRHASQCRRREPCRQLADEQAGEEMLGIGGGTRISAEWTTGRGIFGWAALKGASPAEASHYARPAPQAVASLRVNSAACDFTKSYKLVGVLRVSLDRSSVMRSYRHCA